MLRFGGGQAQAQPTRRQLEVLQLAARGMTAAEIAAALFLSLHTVKAHRENVMRTLGARSTTHAVVIALRRGLLELEGVADG